MKVRETKSIWKLLFPALLCFGCRMLKSSSDISVKHARNEAAGGLKSSALVFFNLCPLGFLCLSPVLKQLDQGGPPLQFKSQFSAFVLLNCLAALDTADYFLILESISVAHFLGILNSLGTNMRVAAFPAPAFSCALSTPLSLVLHLPEQHLGSITKHFRPVSVITFHCLRLNLCIFKLQ